MPNGTSVDQLNIEITASAKSAIKDIDTLCGRLDNLNSKIGGINTTKIAGLANAFDALSKTFKNANIENTSKQIASMNNSFSRISKLDNSAIATIKSTMLQLSESLKPLEKMNFGENLTQISSFNRSIANLGGKAALQAVDNIPKLALAMKDLMKTLSKAPTVNQNLIDMTNALAKLAKTGSSSGKAVTSLSGSMGRLGKLGNPLRGLIRRLLSFVSIWEAIQWGKKSIEIASSLTEVQNVVDVTFGKQRNLIEEMSKTSIADFGMSELTVKEVSSRFQAMGNAMGIANKKVASSSEFLSKKGVEAYGNLGDSMAHMSVNLTKLTADMASFYNKDQKDVAEDLTAIFSGQTRPLRTYGLDLTEATLKEFALKNGLDANIKSMTQAEKAMLRYQYVMANTGDAQGDFARTANTWANQVRILKQNFEALGSVVGGTLINVFKPIVSALNVVIGKFTQFAKVVSQSLGKIFGWEYQDTGITGVADDLEDAEDSTEGLSNGLDKAKDNAKKLKRQLQGFDELNVLTSDKDTDTNAGGGGGGGASGTEGTIGQWTKADSIFKDYESALDSLYKLGDYIGGTLTRTLNNINWENVYEGARNFGAGLASFLNGLISPDLFGALGKTLANSLNTAWQAINSFGETFDWSDFGKSIVTGFTKFVENWDWGLRAETFSTFVRGVLQALTSVFETISDQHTFKVIGQKIVDFINNIDWSGLAWDLGKLAISLGKAIIDTLDDAFREGGIVWNMSGLVVSLYKSIIDGLSGFANKMAENFSKEMEPVWGSLENWFADNFKFKTPEVPSFEEIQSKLKQVTESVKNWWSENAKLPNLSVTVSSIADKLSSAWESAVSWWNSKTALSTISTTVSSIKNKLSSSWSAAVTWWKKKTGLSSVSISVPNIKSKLSRAWSKAKKWWKDNVKLSIPKLTLKVEYKTPNGTIQKAVAKALSLKGWPTLRFYASGGFPEDGWFRANHGELMGKFDNGRTVVANNKQITQGIADAVYQGNRENNALLRQELELMRRQNDLLTDILEKETGISAGELFSSVRQSANDYSRRTGRPAFGY